MPLAPNISNDYLLTDFLVSVSYRSAINDTSFHTAQTVANCTFLDSLPGAEVADADLRRDPASLLVSMHEWPESGTAAQPQRGDRFTITLETVDTEYIVDGVDTDTLALLEWRLTCHRI